MFGSCAKEVVGAAKRQIKQQIALKCNDFGSSRRQFNVYLVNWVNGNGHFNL